MLKYTIIISILFTLLSVCIADWRVEECKRELDMRSQLTREKFTLTMLNQGPQATKSFKIPVAAAHYKNLAHIVILKDGEACLTASPEHHVDWVHIPTQLSSNIAVNQKVTVEVHMVFHKLQSPHPKSITQAEQQYVVFEGSAVCPSAYEVTHQETKFLLPQGKLIQHTSGSQVKPVTHSEQGVVAYGPYELQPAFAVKAIQMHFENNSPFMTVTHLERLIEVSHWGRISVEERIELVHSGAKLQGSFSRYEFQRERRPQQPCVQVFSTLLPAAALDIYYRDEIGNVSTSALRVRPEAVELNIRPRFPLFGGWKTEYLIGYSVPSYQYLYRKDSKFVLQMRFLDHIYDDQYVEKMTLKVILPEKTQNFRLRLPYNKAKQGKTEMHYTYLDYSGRPTLVAHADNLVDKHIQDFQAEYEWQQVSMVQEPLMLVVAFYALFLAVVFWVRLDFSLTHSAVQEHRLKLHGLLEKLQDLCEQRLEVYEQLASSAQSAVTNRDQSGLQAQKKKAEHDAKKLAQQTSELTAQAQSGELNELLSDVNTAERLSRDSAQTLVAVAEKVLQGKASLKQFQEQEKALLAKMQEAQAKNRNAFANN